MVLLAPVLGQLHQLSSVVESLPVVSTDSDELDSLCVREVKNANRVHVDAGVGYFGAHSRHDAVHED